MIIELSLKVYKKHKISKGVVHFSEHFELWANKKSRQTVFYNMTNRIIHGGEISLFGARENC